MIVLALDGVPPELLFDEALAPMLPTISRLRRDGASAPLRSVVPPITVPAWATAMTGLDPGQLGIYGIRDRTPGGYSSFRTASSSVIAGRAVWDRLTEAGRPSTVIGLPPGHPPLRIAGQWVGCMLTPGTHVDHTWPRELSREISDLVGEYVFDVEGFRSRDRSELLDAIREMTRRRWQLARHLLASRESDLFVLHEIGSDRMHHGFWKDHDPAHPRHDPNGRFRTAITDYYGMLDKEIADLLELAPDAHVLILSDHGARPMLGGIRVNQWLVDNGYMRLRGRLPVEATPFGDELVDWPRTAAWGAGGYHARVWLNVRGRDPNGCVEQASVPGLLDEIAAGITAIPGPDGNRLGTIVHRPQDVFRQVRGLAPDLIVYFGALAWRSVATVGGAGWYAETNDTGPDDANHSENGVIVLTPRARSVAPLDGASLLDVAPTLGSLLELTTDVYAGRSLVA